MDRTRAAALRDVYRSELLENVVPFWLAHSLDRECGGYFNCLDRDGGVYSTDKSMILNNRAVWLFSRLYRTLDERAEWLDAAALGFDFLRRQLEMTGNDPFFAVTRDGRPLERFYFSVEAYAAMACAEYGRAAGSQQAAAMAESLWQQLVLRYQSRGGVCDDFVPENRRTRELLVPVLFTGACREVRTEANRDRQNAQIDEAVDDMLRCFRSSGTGLLRETIPVSGQPIDAPQTRLAVPGHSIHVAWMLMEEGRDRGDEDLVSTGCRLLQASLAAAWDEKSDGLLNFIDLESRPTLQIDWDMKLWWVHTEALYATLLAHHFTGASEFAEWHERIHDYAFAHYPDHEHGGWYGYLHRDGTVALTSKGSMWKGVYHVASALWQCIMLLNGMCED